MTHGSGNQTCGRIRPLEPLLVNQIAAGEVIERPASVVKELVENALDAGATSVRVELEEGGIELVRVHDDGGGIAPEDLPLAISPHATSKIRASEDLDRIATLGFRGEALASIASVSRLRICSRTPDRHEAAELIVEGATQGTVRPASHPVGTTVEVRNLFFNTPARRKFLRAARTEQGRCRDWLTDLALARPDVRVTLVCDGKVQIELEDAQGPRRRALDLLGRELESELLEVSFDEADGGRGLTLWGLVGLPSIARATTKAQHVFVNGRAVRDRTIQHALRESYRGLIEPGRHPTCVLLLEMDPARVDVNVHPQKLEVRFRDQSMVHQAVLHAVRSALQRADLTPAFPSRVHAGAREILAPSPDDAVGRFVEQVRSLAPSRPGSSVDFEELRHAARRADEDGPAQVEVPPRPMEVRVPSARPLSRALQVHNQYLVTQDERGLLLIDQHALHERVMFERLLARVREGPLERQRLLAPPVLDADEARQDALERLRPLLTRLGIVCEPMGPTSVAIHEFPTLLFERGVDPGEFLDELLSRACAQHMDPNDEEALHEVLDMMACKSAIKAGDRLSDDEIADLLRQRDAVERSSNCPHGRPTSIRVTIDQLDRMFGRT